MKTALILLAYSSLGWCLKFAGHFSVDKFLSAAAGSHLERQPNRGTVYKAFSQDTLLTSLNLLFYQCNLLFASEQI